VPSLPAAINTGEGIEKKGGAVTPPSTSSLAEQRQAKPNQEKDQQKNTKDRQGKKNGERETENCLERNKVTETERRSNDRREE